MQSQQTAKSTCLVGCVCVYCAGVCVCVRERERVGVAVRSAINHAAGSEALPRSQPSIDPFTPQHHTTHLFLPPPRIREPLSGCGEEGAGGLLPPVEGRGEYGGGRAEAEVVGDVDVCACFCFE